MTDFPERVHSLVRAVHGKIMQILFMPLKDIGLTPPQMFTLRAIAKLGGRVTVGEVCRALNTPLSNTTNICLRLESLGLVKRTRDANDRRKVRITLTDKGKSSMLNTEEVFSRLNEAMDGGFDEAGREQVLGGLTLLDRWLEKYLASEKS